MAPAAASFATLGGWDIVAGACLGIGVLAALVGMWLSDRQRK